MAIDRESGTSQVLSPDDAFAVLGDAARLEILQALGDADGPVRYSDLFERIEYDDSSNFNYHLDKLVGHFVEKSDAGYTLGRPGERVIEAVLSGAVTTDPVREWTETEKPCPFCSAAIEVGYQQERVTMRCPECPGLLGRGESADDRFTNRGNLGYRPLPPSGVQGRTTEDVYHVSEIWTATAMQAVARDVCPRCAGAMEHSLSVCETHDASEGICDRCGYRFGASVSSNCGNCIFEVQSSVASHVCVHPESMAFVIDHGVDPVAPDGVLPFAAVDESIRSRDPFEARYAITLDDETFTATVDEELSIVDTSRDRIAGSG